jgi:hypothetical protein
VRNTTSKPITAEQIIQAACDVFRISMAERRSNTPGPVLCRAMIVAACRQWTHLSYPQIAAAMAKEYMCNPATTGHSSVINQHHRWKWLAQREYGHPGFEMATSLVTRLFPRARGKARDALVRELMWGSEG